jgi:large subunit ribosomal protein L25
MSELVIAAQPRTITRRKSRQLRRDGKVPVVVYGPSTEPTNLQVASRALETALQHGAGSQLLKVKVEGGDVHNVLIREIQRDPVSHRFIHADFYAVDMTQEQDVSITVHSIGEADSLAAGFMMYQALDSVDIRALPSNIPAAIEVDISALTMDNSITIADLPEIEGVTYLGDPTEAIFTVITTRVEEEIEEVEGEEEGMEPELVGEDSDEEEMEEEE